jgi:hypothetical protein
MSQYNCQFQCCFTSRNDIEALGILPIYGNDFVTNATGFAALVIQSLWIKALNFEAGQRLSSPSDIDLGDATTLHRPLLQNL